MKDNETHDKYVEAEIEETASQGRLQQPTPDESRAAESVSVPEDEIQLVPIQRIEPETDLPQQDSTLSNQTNNLGGTETQAESLGAHPSAGKKSYALFDFVLIGFGIVIALSIGLLGAGTEIALTRWLTGYQWVGGVVGGFVSACGGMVASVFFLNFLSKFMYNRDTDRWKRSKEYPKTWHALLLLVFAMIEPSALIVVVILGAIGGGIGYGTSMILSAAWVPVVIALAIPVAAGAIALFLIYDFADGGTV